MHEAATRRDPPVPPFVKNKLAQVTAKLARHDYPLRWPTLVHDLVALADAPEADAPFATDVFCRVLDALDEEIISSGDTIREQGEGQRNPARPPPASVRVKDAIRADGDAAAKLADVWRRRVARGDRAAAATARRYVEWMDVGLFVHPSDETAPPPRLGNNDASSFVAAAKGLLASDDDDLRGAGAELLAALAQKGMDRASKLALVVHRLGLVDACLAMPPTGDEGRDVISAGLVRAVGHELFACLGPPKGGGSSANNLDDATSAAAFAAVERLLPVAVAHARSRDESCALAALPVLAAYVRRLEADESARGSPAAADALACVVDACVRRSAFPDDEGPGGSPEGGSGALRGFDFRDPGDRRAREAEEELAEVRAEMMIVFRGANRVAPGLVRAVVRRALEEAFALAGGSSGGTCYYRWQTAETALSALIQIGEGAADGAVRPGCAMDPSPDGLASLAHFAVERHAAMGHAALAEAAAATGVGGLSNASPSNISGSNAAGANTASSYLAVATHRLVATTFLDVCARYHLVVERFPETLLEPCLRAFLDERGTRHALPEVRRRACYLFCRFAKPLREKMAPNLAPVLAALEPTLADAETADFTLRDAAASADENKNKGKGAGGAMATAGNDDRTYAFEAFGALVGAEEVPEEAQAAWLEAACARLRRRVDECCAGAASDANDSNARSLRAFQARHALVALQCVAKGFTLRVATQTRPRTGRILLEGLGPALRCLGAFDGAGGPGGGGGAPDRATRRRVVALFQRLVSCVGAAVAPHARALVEHVAASGAAQDLCEATTLTNQLFAAFKRDARPLAEATVWATFVKTARALAPFAPSPSNPPSRGGGVGGVLGLTNPNAGGGGGDARDFWPASFPNAGAAIANGTAENAEEAREARELERALAAHCLSLASNDLCEVFAADARSRDVVLATMVRWASAHESAGIRKTALQVLTKLAKAWLPVEEGGPGGAAFSAAAPEAVPGFRAFARDVIVRECCVRAVLRGDLDLRDAGAAGAAQEAMAFLRLALERGGASFADAFRTHCAPLGLDAAAADAILKAACSTAQTAHKDARATVKAAQEMVERAGVVGEEEKRPCTRP